MDRTCIKRVIAKIILLILFFFQLHIADQKTVFDTCIDNVVNFYIN